MGKLTRESLDSDTIKLANDNFNIYYNMLISDNKYSTISRIKKYAPNAWSILSEGQKTRLYRTAKKHRKF
jgi:hypothetical protein